MLRVCSASISEAAARLPPGACGLVPRLLERVRGCKRRQRKAPLGQSCNDWIAGQIELEEMRTHDLAGDADIGKPRLGAQSKRGRCPAREKPFVGRKSLARPVLAPFFDRVRVGAKCLGEMIADPRDYQRMGISNCHECE